MKIAILGATGNVGRRLVAEALRRGYAVTAVARGTAGKLPADPKLRLADVDAHDTSALAVALAGHDAVISSIAFRMIGAASLIDAVRRSGVKRYLVVGGAGSLEVAPGRLLVDTPQFPAAYKEEATKGKLLLDALRETNDLDWTMLSPSALFVPGERTGRFRLGENTLLVGADGQSTVSYEDFSVAMFDELERPAHLRQRFTVGY
jgi:putative NADH-flavin reductase